MLNMVGRKVNSDRVVINVLGFPEDVVHRFQRNIKVSLITGCWEWIGGKTESGYGSIGASHKVRNGKKTNAHQMSWLLYFGEIPEGMGVLHTCDNPPCCNPEHLFLGTNADNVKDKMKKGRHKSGGFLFGEFHPLHGVNHPSNKLSEDDVLEIVRLNKTEKYTNIELANMYGVSKGAISGIICGRTWSWLTGIQVQGVPSVRS